MNRPGKSYTSYFRSRKTFHRFLFLYPLLYSILIILIFATHVEAQIQIGGQYYSGLLWGENEILSPEYYDEGSFLRTDQDFILTAGRNWKGDPPPSQGSFLFERKEIYNSGLFNNEAVSLLEKGKIEDRLRAISMLEEGVRFDPKFFPFRYNLGRAYHLEKNIKSPSYNSNTQAQKYRNITEPSFTWERCMKLYENRSTPQFSGKKRFRLTNSTRKPFYFWRTTTSEPISKTAPSFTSKKPQESTNKARMREWEERESSFFPPRISMLIEFLRIRNLWTIWGRRNSTIRSFIFFTPKRQVK